MDRATIHTTMKDDALDISVHGCPRKLFDSLNVEKKERGDTIWKNIKEGGLDITFFLEEKSKSGA